MAVNFNVIKVDPTDEDDIYELAKNLYGKHIEYLGSGAFGQVYSTTKRNRVVKVGEMDDNHAYLSWIREVVNQNQRNPFLPRVYSVTRINAPYASYFSIELEKLTAVEHSGYEYRSPYEDIVDYIDNYLHRETTNERSLRKFIKTKKELKLFHSALDLIKVAREKFYKMDENSECGFDIHTGNIMLRRNSQIVITDPIC